MSETPDIADIRDEWGAIAAGYLTRVAAALDGDPKAVRVLIRDLHAADLADLIESLDQDDRVRLIAALGKSFDV